MGIKEHDAAPRVSPITPGIVMGGVVDQGGIVSIIDPNAGPGIRVIAAIIVSGVLNQRVVKRNT